ncbi:MAG: lycopene cyclase, partial [Myxococcales bacterium]
MAIDDEALGEGRLRELPGGDEALARIEHLERSWGQRRSFAELTGPDRGAALDADVVMAGGGLWLTLAPYLARQGLRVAVIERGQAGHGHREWNISGPELRPLSRSGLFTEADVEALVAARYREGVCRWHGGSTWPVRGVLDHAIDGESYLTAIRERTDRAGVRVLDGHQVT